MKKLDDVIKRVWRHGLKQQPSLGLVDAADEAKHQIYTDLMELADIPQPTYINDLSAPESWNAVKDKLRAAIREYCGVHDER